MIKIFFTVTLLMAGMTMLMAQNMGLGAFEAQSDIGNVKVAGSAEYNAQDQSYTVSGSGTNMWFAEDAFHFVYKQIKGDFIVQALVEFVGDGVEQHRKIGWMARNTLDSNSQHINATIHGDGLTSLQYRLKKGAETMEIKSEITGARVIQLQRHGKKFIMSAAVPGEPFTTTGLTDSTLYDKMYVGIYVCSHNADVLEKAIFRNVRIIIPAPDDFKPYQDYIGSYLEIMDLKNNFRQIVYTAKNSIQAPNWTKDGASLIYNRDGLLYNFDIKSREPKVLETGFATSNNNDHVLSFDGKYLGISNHSKVQNGNSLIYFLPSKGGTPQQVTPFGPSYLHGWSLDGKELVYTGGRNDQYDIYKISVDGGEEIQLTNTTGLDDGSEYSPDGQYIYFNSNRTGTMQIWRMKPDGSDQEQITFDDFNNWFPHISPDGKWIVFLSFGKEVPSGDHPFYKNVYLRLMPYAGGDAKVIAYLYGGQGTINVPSWSPDSKKIAFVSNSVVN